MPFHSKFIFYPYFPVSCLDIPLKNLSFRTAIRRGRKTEVELMWVWGGVRLIIIMEWNTDTHE